MRGYTKCSIENARFFRRAQLTMASVIFLGIPTATLSQFLTFGLDWLGCSIAAGIAHWYGWALYMAMRYAAEELDTIAALEAGR